MWPRQQYLWAVALAVAGTRAQTPESVDVIVVGGGASGKQILTTKSSVSCLYHHIRDRMPRDAWTRAEARSFPVYFLEYFLSRHISSHALTQTLSGTHAAVRLRDDFNKTVLIVEKANRLGGHVHAYNPGNGGRNVNYGVQAYLNRDTTQSFFNRFGVKLIDPDLTDVSVFASLRVCHSQASVVDRKRGGNSHSSVPTAKFKANLHNLLQ